MAKRIAIFSLSSILLILGFAFFVSPQAHAEPYSGMSIDDKTSSIVYYYGMDTCFNGINNIDNGSVSKGIYDNDDSVTVGHFVDYEDGKMSCKDMVSQAKDLWYDGSLEAMLKDMGYRLEGNNWKLSGNILSQILPKIRSKVFNGQDPPSLSSPQKFILYNQALRGGCDLKNPSGPVNKMTDSEKANYSSSPNKYILVDVIDGETTVKKYYEYNQPSEGGDGTGGVAGRLLPIPVSSTDTPNILTQATCKELASGVGSNITAYSNSDEKSTKDLSGAGDRQSEKAAVTCRIQAIGWIVCPVVSFLASITDSAYSIVASMLTVQNIGTNTDQPLYQAWSVIRNIANVCFVIAFLVIIYSQITSAGISNYGIKKLLPKLIVSAVLVNVSFWLCILAVDISNFLGYSVSNMFSSLAKSINITQESGLSTGNKWGALAAGIIGLYGAINFLQLAMLLPLLVGAVLVIVTVVIILTLRQGLIVMLIIVSPLAFVAYLLPNTSKLFDRWWDAFKVLLLMFPIIAFVYAASKIAGEIITGVADSMKDTDPMKVGFQLMGAAIPILSFITIYALMKSSSLIISKFMNNNPAKGVADRARKGAENRGKRWDNQRASFGNKRGGIAGKLIGGRARARAKGRSIDRAAEHNLNIAEAGYMANAVKESKPSLLYRASGGNLGSQNKLAGQLGRGLGEAGQASALANAIQTNLELEVKEVSAQRAIIKDLNLTESQKADASMGKEIRSDSGKILIQSTSNNEAGRALRMAAQQSVIEGGDTGQINRVIDHMQQRQAFNADGTVNTDNASELNNFADTLEKSSNKPSWVQPGDLVAMRTSGSGEYDENGNIRLDNDGNPKKITQRSTDDMMKEAIKAGVYSPQKFAQMGNQETGILKDYIQRKYAENPNTTEFNQIISNAQEALANERIAPTIGKNKDKVSVIANIRGPQAQNPQNAPTVAPNATTNQFGQRFDQADEGGLYVPR